MPQFSPGETRTAKVTMRNPTGKAFDYTGFLYMGTELTVMAEVSFHLEAGEEKQVDFSVTMPSVAGTYPVYIGVFSGGQNIALYRATEDVVISPPAKFAYVSDIYRDGYGLESGHTVYYFAVDVQNVGEGAGVCNNNALYINFYNPNNGTWLGWSGPMGTWKINSLSLAPGQKGKLRWYQATLSAYQYKCRIVGDAGTIESGLFSIAYTGW
jgi:hypothetical protein